MYNKIREQGGLRHQRGVSLILVLFLLVVVSLLAAAMAQLNRGGSNAVSLEIQSVRASFAAESGAQIAAMKLFPIGGTTPGCTAVPATVPPSPATSFAAIGLTNCTATLTCSSPTNTTGPTIYTVTSEGKCGSGDDYARRRITIGLRSL